VSRWNDDRPEMRALRGGSRGRSAIVVAARPDGFEVLDACSLDGAYVLAPESASGEEPIAPADAHDVSHAPLRRSWIETQKTGAWRLAYLGGPTLPDNAACAGATHVVAAIEVGWYAIKGVPASAPVSLGGIAVAPRSFATTLATSAQETPLVAVLRPIDAEDRSISCAAPVHFDGKPGEAWALRAGDADVCALPCDRWVLADEDRVASRLELRRRDADVALPVPPTISPPSGDAEVLVRGHRDGTWPALPVIATAVGAASLTVAYFMLSSSGGGTTGTDSPQVVSSAGSNTSNTLLGAAFFLGVGTVALGYGAWGLVTGPSVVDQAEVVRR
jgi:hypothetical protein